MDVIYIQYGLSQLVTGTNVIKIQSLYMYIENIISWKYEVMGKKVA